MTALFKRYVTFTEEDHAFVCALWCAQTWFFHTQGMHGAEYAPYLAFASPISNCGKTAALTVTAALSYGSPPVSVMPNPAPLFRRIQEHHHTIVLDELDLLREDSELITILNSGYKKGATVERMTGRDRDQVSKFETFCPKALGYIRDSKSLKAIRGTLESRCIRILLKRRTLDEQSLSPQLRLKTLEKECGPILARLMNWVLGLDKNLLNRETSRVPDIVRTAGMFGREEEVWENLLAVAHLAGRLREAQKAAMDLIWANREEAEDHNTDSPLLRDLQRNMNDMCDEEGFSLELAIKFLNQMEDRTYRRWTDGNGITVQALRRILAKYGLRTRQMGSRRLRRIKRKGMEDVLARHLPLTDEE